MVRTTRERNLISLDTFKAPQGYNYSVEDFNKIYFRVWLNHHYPYSYTTDKVRTVWGFIRKKDHSIIRPINSTKPGQLVDDLSTCTAYSAMEKPTYPLQQFFS